MPFRHNTRHVVVVVVVLLLKGVKTPAQNLIDHPHDPVTSRGKFRKKSTELQGAWSQTTLSKLLYTYVPN